MDAITTTRSIVFTYSEYPKVACEDIVRLRRALDRPQLPPRRTDDNLLIVTCPLSGMWTGTRARNSSGSTVSVPAVGLVGAVGHGLGGPVIREPLQGEGIPRAIAREPDREGSIVLGNPHRGVDVEPRVRAVSTHHPRGAGLTMLAADERFRKRAPRASCWSARSRRQR